MHVRVMLRVRVVATMADVGADLLWTHQPSAVAVSEMPDGSIELVAGYAHDRDAMGAERDLGALPGVRRLERGDPTDASWVDTWRQNASPYRVGPLHVRLPEHAPDDTVIDIEIEPAATFGYGHVTTILVLELLTSPPVVLTGKRLADIGSGSGIVAIAAARLGAHRVDAVDIHPGAVAATRTNATRNAVTVTAMLGSAEALPGQGYDIVVANLTAATLCEIADAIVTRIAPGAQLILSGVLDDHVTRVLAAFDPLVPQTTVSRSGWSALLLDA